VCSGREMSIFRRHSVQTPGSAPVTPAARTGRRQSSVTVLLGGSRSVAAAPSAAPPHSVGSPRGSKHEVYFVRGRPFIAPAAGAPSAADADKGAPSGNGGEGVEGLGLDERLQLASRSNDAGHEHAARRFSNLGSAARATLAATRLSAQRHSLHPVDVARGAATTPHARSGRRGSLPAGLGSGAAPSSVARANEIAEEEWAALFRNNLLRSCWRPGLNAEVVQHILQQQERKLVEALHRWRNADAIELSPHVLRTR
jgi:hypothetical protein